MAEKKKKRVKRPPKKSETGKTATLDNRYAKAELAADILGEDAESHKDLLAELTANQRHVMRLKLRGATQEQIAIVMGVSQPAISKTIKRVKEHLAARGKSIDQAEVIGENLTFYEDIEKEAWDIKDKLEDGDKLKAIQVLMAARKDRNKLLMDVGLLTVAPKETLHTVRSTPFLDAMRQEQRVDEVVISAIATTQDELEEPEPPQLGTGDDTEEDPKESS